MQQDLADKFTSMMTKVVSSLQHDLQQNFCQSFAKIDNRYDNISNQVDNLNKQYQQLLSIISNMQAKFSSFSSRTTFWSTIIGATSLCLTQQLFVLYPKV